MTYRALYSRQEKIYCRKCKKPLYASESRAHGICSACKKVTER